jgi:hypothetical protein
MTTCRCAAGRGVGGTYDMGFRDYDPGPQSPARQAVERDEQAIAWLRW